MTEARMSDDALYGEIGRAVGCRLCGRVFNRSHGMARVSHGYKHAREGTVRVIHLTGPIGKPDHVRFHIVDSLMESDAEYLARIGDTMGHDTLSDGE